MSYELVKKIKQRSGNRYQYRYLVESQRKGERVIQKVVKYLGRLKDEKGVPIAPVKEEKVLTTTARISKLPKYLSGRVRINGQVFENGRREIVGEGVPSKRRSKKR